MAKMSFFDKLKIMIEMTKSSKVFILVILSLVFLAILFITTSRKNFKSSKIIYIAIYAIILASLLYAYRGSLGKMYEYLVNNVFIAIYFPNFAIYLVAIVISNIILWVSLFSRRIKKLIKNINIVVYCVMTYILILIINIININDLDVYTQSSIYSNENALALIELSSAIFITWIIFLIIYNFIRYFQRDKEREAAIKRARLLRQKQKEALEIENSKKYRMIDAPYIVKREDNSTILEKNKALLAEYEKLLTVDDYKVILSMLKQQKEQGHQKKQESEIEHLENQLTIKDEQLEKKIIIKKEQDKFQELQNLYSVR